MRGQYVTYQTLGHRDQVLAVLRLEPVSWYLLRNSYIHHVSKVFRLVYNGLT